MSPNLCHDTIEALEEEVGLIQDQSEFLNRHDALHILRQYQDRLHRIEMRYFENQEINFVEGFSDQSQDERILQEFLRKVESLSTIIHRLIAKLEVRDLRNLFYKGPMSTSKDRTMHENGMKERMGDMTEEPLRETSLARSSNYEKSSVALNTQSILDGEERHDAARICRICERCSSYTLELDLQVCSYPVCNLCYGKDQSVLQGISISTNSPTHTQPSTPSQIEEAKHSSYPVAQACTEALSSQHEGSVQPLSLTVQEYREPSSSRKKDGGSSLFPLVSVAREYKQSSFPLTEESIHFSFPVAQECTDSSTIVTEVSQLMGQLDSPDSAMEASVQQSSIDLKSQSDVTNSQFFQTITLEQESANYSVESISGLVIPKVVSHQNAAEVFQPARAMSIPDLATVVPLFQTSFDLESQCDTSSSPKSWQKQKSAKCAVRFHGSTNPILLSQSSAAEVSQQQILKCSKPIDFGKSEGLNRAKQSPNTCALHNSFLNYILLAEPQHTQLRALDTSSLVKGKVLWKVMRMGVYVLRLGAQGMATSVFRWLLTRPWCTGTPGPPCLHVSQAQFNESDDNFNALRKMYETLGNLVDYSKEKSEEMATSQYDTILPFQSQSAISGSEVICEASSQVLPHLSSSACESSLVSTEHFEFTFQLVSGESLFILLQHLHQKPYSMEHWSGCNQSICIITHAFLLVDDVHFVRLLYLLQSLSMIPQASTSEVELICTNVAPSLQRSVIQTSCGSNQQRTIWKQLSWNYRSDFRSYSLNQKVATSSSLVTPILHSHWYAGFANEFQGIAINTAHLRVEKALERTFSHIPVGVISADVPVLIKIQLRSIKPWPIVSKNEVFSINSLINGSNKLLGILFLENEDQLRYVQLGLLAFPENLWKTALVDVGRWTFKHPFKS
ncbi:uncharacterized protein LOC129795482 [Lutzomyia longipalpis]|uniref:uncharacterized protein LOC129795482 n=1 Tax=Lutzomyia longipalpis TaxID=7200 RepID=UPI002483BE84|nr:uncharacterized protein LOC129795482 [Lutzomyia longipalpis]XP_055692781.1 uncharacterized protein LOC129795482 [Lutzomyia longipalpis]